MSKSLFDVAATVESTVWQMRLGDFARSYNRTQINNLFNGDPPELEEEAERQNHATNVNFLEPTRLSHDARGQALNALTNPANFFTVTIDRGPRHKRKAWSTIITREINKTMKRSLLYYEKTRSDVASLVLHGIGPGSWDNADSWCPDPNGVEDVLVPGNTMLTMKNLPFFAIYRPYTANQLRKLTSGPKVDPAWNMKMVNRLIEKAEKQVFDYGIPNSEIYSPEKMAERIKADAGTIACDSVPTIDAWDFYFWNDSNKVSGWNRRVILDASWQGGIGAAYASDQSTSGLTNVLGGRDEFLYNPGTRKYAAKLGEIIHWQFADLSAVAPFKYHSVRSLGFLMYAVCHLQNRLRCRFTDAVFEHMMQYFRVTNESDVEKALKINLYNLGFIDESIKFIPANERWQVNAALAGMALNENASLINRNAAGYTSTTQREKGDRPKTATEVMSDVQTSTQLLSAGLSQAYTYKKFEFMEIARRFSRCNSKDPEVRATRLRILKQGVPEEIVGDVDCWDIETEKVMGGGNKMMEMAIADKLMGARQFYDPEAQREILHDYTLAVTSDAARANALVPDQPVRVTDSVHDAQLSVGPLMMGARLDPKMGVNHIEIVETLLGELGLLVDQTMQMQNATPEKLAGFGNMANYIGQHIAIIAQNKKEGQRVKEYGDALGKIGNEVKALSQQLAQSQPQPENGELAKAKLELELEKAKGQIKLEQSRASHSQRTAQRQTQSELETKRAAEKHALEMEQMKEQNRLDTALKISEAHSDEVANAISTAAEMRRAQELPE